MKKFKITKSFRGGGTDYYAKMSVTKKMKRGCWKYQLEDWGACTDGGHNYGYRVDINKIKEIPKGVSKFRRLEFNKEYLT